MERATRRLPAVIYLHGNSSSRLEALPVLSPLLQRGVTVFAFDFAGSGLSDGEHVSLGYFEREDVEAAVDYLANSGTVSTIGLWGRSMGAVTALMYVARGHHSISGIVCDSPFADLQVLSKEFAESYLQIPVPKLMVSAALEVIRSTILQRANFDILDLAPIKIVSECTVPVMFVAAHDDKFIDPHHTKQLYEAYGGPKTLEMVEGDHNSMRLGTLQARVAAFLVSELISSDQPDGGIRQHRSPA
eukprot:CAMPEP_0204381206 /NCGR_PEP_ID=MMETSP0469-20131031/54028_1 /ASSEMBLY_ACC=CAM_ASM_000384 /TAXON_ID=2969 /ORGANISM="Oxyrrhis marina" /LENGTH=244 /DNA_ID=CAMNT_0051372993 /DNA_START=112 /DNA_END=843 /DNA_ORIENTATION=+